jgi:hypothetical protein
MANKKAWTIAKLTVLKFMTIYRRLTRIFNKNISPNNSKKLNKATKITTLENKTIDKFEVLFKLIFHHFSCYSASLLLYLFLKYDIAKIITTNNNLESFCSHLFYLNSIIHFGGLALGFGRSRKMTTLDTNCFHNMPADRSGMKEFKTNRTNSL